jgi:RHS repeat-associated protein
LELFQPAFNVVGRVTAAWAMEVAPVNDIHLGIISYDYDNVGNLQGCSYGTTPNNYLYCGEQFDPDLGLYYNRARYLDSDSGRFWTRDTYEGSKYSPRSLQKYLYASADAVNNTDPTGYETTVAEATETLGIDSIVQKNVNVVANEARRRAVRKVGCEIAKFATVQGVYVLVLGDGEFYVGQSKDIIRRLGEHARDLTKAGARIVGMLEITTGIKSVSAAKYLREIFEAALIKELAAEGNVIKNPISGAGRLAKYVDPVQAGVDKLFKLTPLCR